MSDIAWLLVGVQSSWECRMGWRLEPRTSWRPSSRPRAQWRSPQVGRRWPNGAATRNPPRHLDGARRIQLTGLRLGESAGATFTLPGLATCLAVYNMYITCMVVRNSVRDCIYGRKTPGTQACSGRGKTAVWEGGGR
eukprot:363694-Chlamydomonas_euryale.AAC.23